MYKYSDVFDNKLGHTKLVTHKIDTGNNRLIKQAPQRLPYVHRDEANRQVVEMLQNVIRLSTSAWSSPVILVKKEW
jgi:hypothetical protein